MIKFEPPMLKDEVSRATTHKQTYIQSKNCRNIFFLPSIFLTLDFCLKRRFPIASSSYAHNPRPDTERLVPKLSKANQHYGT